MYLIDTNVVSEARKRDKANPGIVRFFGEARTNEEAVYVSVITIAEIRRGLELIRHRDDTRQASRLETWLGSILKEYEEHILDFNHDEAQVWGGYVFPTRKTPSTSKSLPQP
jgi:toxin FitB